MEYHIPRVYFLNEAATEVQEQLMAELRSSMDTKQTEKAKPAFGKSKAKSKPTKEPPPNGNISSMVITHVSGFPLLFVGYESGALGALRLYLDAKNKLCFEQIITVQKFIQD
mmetsp:Transcript_40791/g.39385  ORF Transcript_40791/g.39385 Transcript_40791/m.39385 type:complete len:112 (-) Transcript_40791:234-569(-)